HPTDRPAGVELGRHGVELAPGLVDDSDGDEVDRVAVLDELAVVEEPQLTHPAAMSARAKSRARAPNACAWPAGFARAQRVAETAGHLGRDVISRERSSRPW